MDSIENALYLSQVDLIYSLRATPYMTHLDSWIPVYFIFYLSRKLQISFLKKEFAANTVLTTRGYAKRSSADNPSATVNFVSNSCI